MIKSGNGHNLPLTYTRYGWQHFLMPLSDEKVKPGNRHKDTRFRETRNLPSTQKFPIESALLRDRESKIRVFRVVGTLMSR